MVAAQAQTGVHFGAKAGLSLAVISGSLNQASEYKPGFHAGGVMRWRPSTRVAIQPELVFSQQGANHRFPSGPVTLESKTKLSHLNLPVLVKVYLGNVINVQVGPQFGMLLAARHKGQVAYYSGSNGEGFVTENMDVKADYKGDVGLCGGLGADLKNGLLLTARLTYGLTDINDNAAEKQLRKQFGIDGLYNRVFEFSAGYVFGTK